MVAMPYILVNLVLSGVALVLFSVTTAALLVGLPAAKRNLLTRTRRVLVFLALAAALAGLVIGVLQVLARVVHGFYPLSVFETLFCVALVNAMVLAYRYLSKRWFRTVSAVPRGILIGAISIVVVLVPALAILIASYALFLIR